MRTSILTLDSRNRINDDYPNNCQFLLQDAIIASKFELTTFQFANTLYNVTSHTNTLYVSGILAATSTPKFWIASDFITDLNTQLKAYFVTVSDVVTLDTSTNILTWVLPAGSITASPMNRILGIVGTPSGSFTTNLFLTGVTVLALMSPQLNTFSYNSYPSTQPVCGVIPVTSGYMTSSYYEPAREWSINFHPRLSFNFLQINWADNRNGHAADGMGEWSASFIVTHE